MDFTPENLCGFLIRSRLMSPEEMKNMYQRWQAESRNIGTGLSQFTRWLVANNYVTEYQANLLAKGHAEPEVYFLNQYKVLERLGRGRMAGVYKAVHTLGQVVAIKVLPPSRAKNPAMLARFQREAQLALKLKHPNCVRSFQVGEANGLHYLVMEYLDGETLEDVLERRKRLPPQEAVRLVHQALVGLQHIADHGIVHRDLKPSNLMLTPLPAKGEPDNTMRATVKILDIGLARALFEESQPAQDGEITAEGVILGTPDYLAPEQARDPRNIDIRADIYSLGCVLYHALTGQPPFPDANLLNQMVRHATETPRPLKDFNPSIPDGLQQILSYMMAKKPEERYPTPERAAQALQMFLMADSEPAKAAEAPQMRKYLTWLETAAAPGGPDATVPPSGGAPSTMAAPRKSKETPPPAPRPSKKHKKHRLGASQPAGVALPATTPGTPAAPLNPAEFDVELVPLPANPGAAASVEPKILWGLSKRDWILVGIGGGAVFVVMLFGIMLVNVFS